MESSIFDSEEPDTSSDIFERVNKVLEPIDYMTILNSGIPFTDEVFPPDDSSLFSKDKDALFSK